MKYGVPGRRPRRRVNPIRSSPPSPMCVVRVKVDGAGEFAAELYPDSTVAVSAVRGGYTEPLGKGRLRDDRLKGILLDSQVRLAIEGALARFLDNPLF